jgi:hypothetical protein
VEELQEWVEHELNGYPTGAELPDYRKLKSMVRGTIMEGTVMSHSKHVGAVVPLHNVEPPIRDFLTTFEWRGAVAEIEDVIACAAGPQVTLALEDEVRRYIGAKQGIGLVSAQRALSRPAFVALLDTIRTRVLQFALKLERKHPSAAESDRVLSDIPVDEATYLFINSMQGDVVLGESNKQVITDAKVGAATSGSGGSAKG